MELRLVMDVSSTQTPTVNSREAQKETQQSLRENEHGDCSGIAFERRANLPWLKCPLKEYESNQDHFNVSLVQIRMLDIFTFCFKLKLIFPLTEIFSDEWNLRISSPGLQDSGSYECQVFLQWLTINSKLRVSGRCKISTIF